MGGRVGDRLQVSVSMHDCVSVIRVGANTRSLFTFIDLRDLSAGPRRLIEAHQRVLGCRSLLSAGS